jgi:uncharacterized protein (TIRG00374 family)
LVVAVLAAAAVAVLLAYRWRELRFEWSEFAGTFRQLRWAWVALAAALALATYLGRALRWQVLLRPVQPRSSLGGLVSATAIGFTAIVLFGRAGEPVRPYLIALKERVSFSSQIAAWLIERMLDLLTALLIFGFALSQVDQAAVSVGPALAWVLRVGGYVAAAAGLASLGILAAFLHLSGAMRRRLLDALAFLPPPKRERLERIVEAFAQGMESARNGGYIVLLAFYSLLEWTLIVLCNVSLFRALPATASFSLRDVVIFVGFAAFGAVVQIPGIGGGVQVVSVVILRELFGLPLEAATGLALLIWIVTFVVILPFGLALAFHEGLTFGKLRKLEQEAAAL